MKKYFGKISIPFQLAFIYLVLGLCWIFFSDRALIGLKPETSILIQHYKGFLFVFLSSLLLFFLMRFYVKRNDKTQEEIRRSNKQINDIMHSITDGFFAVDRQWNFTLLNNTACRLFGRKAEELTGKNMWTLFPNREQTSSYKLYHEAVTQNHPVHFEDNIESMNLWFEVHAYPTPEGLFVFFRNVSREKIFEKENLRQQQVINALINNTNELIWSIDTNYVLTYANKPFLAAVKRFNGTVLEPGQSSLLITEEDSPMRKKWVALYQRALNGEMFTVIDETDLGTEKSYREMNMNPIRDNDGKIIGVGCFSKNIGEKIKEEKEKNLLIRKLQKQNKDLEEFSYIISHNLRAPVATLLGLTNIFNKEEIHDEVNLKVIDNLNESAKRLDDVVKDLGQIIDINYNVDKTKEKIQLQELTNQIKDMLASEIKKHGETEIVTDFHQAPVVVSANVQLKSILFNLVSNAIKYKKPGQKNLIEIKTTVAEKGWKISVKDSGQGINIPRYKEKMFKLYSRFHSNVEGKGIGLYLVRTQVEALGGEIDVQSEEGVGTTFEIFLPEN